MGEHVPEDDAVESEATDAIVLDEVPTEYMPMRSETQVIN